MFLKNIRKQKRKLKIKQRVKGTDISPRLSVYRSNDHIYVQAIDDVKKVTIADSSDVKAKTGTNVEKAKAVGIEIAKKLSKLKITTAVFDRSGYKYHGRVEAVAEGAREGGLKF